MLANRLIQEEKTNLATTYIELSFEVTGASLPADHCYGLYSAISHLCPKVHEQEGISVQTISGEPDRKGQIKLRDYSRLKIRVPSNAESLPTLLPLAGQKLTIGKHEIQLGFPKIAPLKPASSLQSRLVTIKGYKEPAPFLDAVDRQMQDLGIQALVGIPANEAGEPKRLTLKIKRYTIIGFSVVVQEISPDDSLRLQIYGLGGKRRMGCGVFVPVSLNT